MRVAIELQLLECAELDLAVSDIEVAREFVLSRLGSLWDALGPEWVNVREFSVEVDQIDD